MVPLYCNRPCSDYNTYFPTFPIKHPLLILHSKTSALPLNSVRALHHTSDINRCFPPHLQNAEATESCWDCVSIFTAPPGKCSTHFTLINDIRPYLQCFFKQKKKKKKKNQFVPYVALFRVLCFSQEGVWGGERADWMLGGRKTQIRNIHDTWE